MSNKPQGDPPAYPAATHQDAGAYPPQQGCSPAPYVQSPPPGAGADYYNNHPAGYGAPGQYGSAPPPQGYYPPQQGYPPQGYPQQGYGYGAPPGGMYYQQGPPPQGYYAQDRGGSSSGGICAGIMAALACCCCLDILF